MPIVSENDQKILNTYNAMIASHMKASRDAGNQQQTLAEYRAMMLAINPYKKPPGYREAEVASFRPAVGLRPGLTAAVAVPRGRGPFPVIVHAHGHGLRAGRPPEYSPWMRIMASYGFVVVFPDYRWQPEASYDDQIDDMMFSIDWVRRNGAGVGADPTRMILGGDSAGCSLAMDVLLRTLADPAGPRFRAFESVDGFVNGLPPNGDLMTRVKAETPFPPLAMVVGSADFAASAALTAAQALTPLRKPYELQVYYGMPHDFAKFPQLEVMHRANERLMTFLQTTV